MATILGQSPIHLYPTRAAAQAVCDRLNQDPAGDPDTWYEPYQQTVSKKWLVQIIDKSDEEEDAPLFL